MGLDSRHILEGELARFDKGDKIFVLTLENRVGEMGVCGAGGVGRGGLRPLCFTY